MQAVRQVFVLTAANNTITSVSSGLLAAGCAPGQTLFIGNAANTVSLLNRGSWVIDSVTDDAISW